MTATIHLGDCRQIIATLDDNSIHSIVTDPPYELGFMGKKWDASGIAYDVTLWSECLRVLKPGGHLLAFGGTRTYHRMACAIEDAGFEIRDSIVWLYGSGFPKSLDVSKAIDKAAGAEREVVGTRSTHRERPITDKWDRSMNRTEPGNPFGDNPLVVDVTAPATDAARQWSGWGTALKPANEPIVVARKPLVGTVAANVQQYGTGALNIDGARVGRVDGDSASGWSQSGSKAGENIAMSGRNYERDPKPDNAAGRWPANVITDGSIEAEWVRYFYCAKASKAERNAGLDALPERDRNEQSSWVRQCGVCGCRFTDPMTGKPKCEHDDVKYTPPSPTKNTHPTVKPLALMRYLVRLVTPPGGTVLEPFAGSGTTLAAAILEGFNAIGCELTEDYLPIIEGRIAWAEEQIKPDPESLFNQ
jgi:DNA modification methylase